MTRFSVILCSRNREVQVSRCLAELDLNAFQALDGELILVNSASTDSTGQVLASFKQRNPDIPTTLVTVEKPGLSIARNAGVEAASGAILIFLDDDVYLGDGYIEKALKRLEVLSPGVGFVGGRILLYDPADSLYGTNFKTKYRECSGAAPVRPGAFQGTNFCIRREVFGAVGGFDNELGAGKKFRCEDIDFVARALACGFKGAFDPALVVYHHHGRRDGPDTIAMDRENVYASGAFYAKMSRQRGPVYLIKGTIESILLFARRSLPHRITLAFPWTAFNAFWSGFRDYRRVSVKTEPVRSSNSV